ncbi:hypothetical protein PsorP6_007241 [Peronosclerospora sorghi]|uniref:Uncharacterized protein n=1 Tax=Peronosclerospora sorghi TaxID=230839 RepID=A0ACC0WBQ4_9STRA|nr:hypothetical protein PsorP6_007241 [Peronosclerospora sorghi]
MTAPSLVDARNEPSKQSLLLTTMCLPSKVDETLSLLHELTTDTQFLSDENLRQLRLILQSTAATASSNISSSGAALAAIRSRIGLTPASIFDEYYSGISHIEQLQDLAKCSENELRDVAQLLQDIAHRVFPCESSRLCSDGRQASFSGRAIVKVEVSPTTGEIGVVHGGPCVSDALRRGIRIAFAVDQELFRFSPFG